MTITLNHTIVPARDKLIGAMTTVRQLLDAAYQPAPTRTVVLRDPRPGDLGWVELALDSGLAFREIGLAWRERRGGADAEPDPATHREQGEPESVRASVSSEFHAQSIQG